MTNVSRTAKSRKISPRQLPLAGLVLWSLLLTVLPFSAFSAQKERFPKERVYCPLSKRLQFVKAPETKKEEKPFDAICASKPTKNYLFQEIVLKTPWRVFTLDANDFEGFVFDFLARGKAAFDKLPLTPGAPSGNLGKRVALSIASNNRGEHKFIWKYSAAKAAFSFNLKARPPTTGDANNNYFNVPIYRSAILSPRRAPRAPPRFS